MTEPEDTNDNENEQSQSKLDDRIDSLLGQLESDPVQPPPEPEPVVYNPPPPALDSVGLGFQSFFNNPDRPVLNIDSMKNNTRLESIMGEIEVEKGRKRRLEDMQLKADDKKTQYNHFGLYALIVVALASALKALTTGVSIKKTYDDTVKKRPMF